MTLSNQANDAEKAALITELQQAGIKHAPEEIVRIGKTDRGTIIFLEIGKGGDRGSGLTHIIENHRQDFINRDISESQIPDAVMAAVKYGTAIGTQGRSRTIYQIDINGITQYISVEVSINGYIVGANPTSTRLIQKLIQGQ
ncbi:MAG: hypothetical protein ACM65L_21055 [Microcoleus sp.]